MELSSVFGGDSLKASDLQGQEHTVVIASVDMKKFDNGNKLVITFQGKKKALICNKTNANRIGYIHGTNTDNWIGREIVLFTDLVDYQGKVMEAIRIRPAARRAPEPAPRQHVVTDRGGYSTSEIRPAMKDGLEEVVGRASDKMDQEIPF